MSFRGLDNKIAIAISVMDTQSTVVPGTWLHVHGSEFVASAGRVIPVVGQAEHPALGVVVKCHRADTALTWVLLQTRGEVLLRPSETPSGWSVTVVDPEYVLMDTPAAVDDAPPVDPSAPPRQPTPAAASGHLQLAAVRRIPMRFGD